MSKKGNGDEPDGNTGFEAGGQASAQIAEKIGDSSLPDEERALAVKLGGDLMNMDDTIAERLIEVVRSAEESEELRSTAAIALGPVLEDCDLMGFDFDDDDVAISEQTFQRLREELRTLVVDDQQPREVRRSAMEASVRAPDDWHPAQIRKALASDDDLWRLTAVFSMGFVGGFEGEILEALDHEDPRMQREAVLAAGHQGVEEAFGRIRQLARSEDTERALRLAAVEALAGYDSRAAYELLAELTDHHDEEIAELAEYGLSFMADPDGLRSALLGLTDDEDDDGFDEDDEDDPEDDNR